ncbi:methionyl-tRNA formyltransferase [Colwellia sp. 1_MG-2023]|uniref:methionyl-tRNA formyltransferase n=1 Tax=unclassified Colwellia TaxID=196834 RepID=UPI001C090236|nr:MULTISPECIES: methionyl-tRNA formyltransferase [unclassified Colwellia]MBU2923497.1 methionyl-tRNA formyltransferase [Colwellia sp. C2M11]MDO6653329.1 methionyl-tRNA formyltransferase [Colwellia sp. 3_MG-2023]MDO6664426.1 methionyl-tRNA formyltransferase [Colwellia sp. 2_MG-2023]MDO6688777.1 methionyl-tRNA formyltransferase [Colwellia sp. 1_MG-2023]
MLKPLNIIFAGTPDFAAQHLAALINSPHNVVAVYCPPDKPAGRGKKLTACATKLLALENNLPIEQPVNFKELSSQQQLAQYNADVMVVVAYGLLLPEIILTTPHLGCINVHGSLLPKWRGAAPIQRSLEAGDPKTGVTIMQMDKGLDTGDMILTAECTIENNDTSASLYEKLAQLGPTALIDTLALMTTGTHKAITQNNALATYAHKLDKNEAEINWNLTADELDRKIRAYIPWPVAQFTFTDNSESNKQHRIRIWQASVKEMKVTQPAGSIISVDKEGIVVATAKGAICLEVLQLPNKKALPIKDILNGRADWFTVGAKINGTDTNSVVR